MSDQRMPTEEELAAAYEEQLRQLRVEDVVLQTIVSLMNLGARKAGLAGGQPDEVDPAQVHLAIEGARALLPLVEAQLGPDAAQLREALSQLQLAYVRLGGAPEAGDNAEGPVPQQPAAPQPGQPGAAQQSGRLWVPGQ